MTGTDPTGEISELSSTLASVEAVLDPEAMRREADVFVAEVRAHDTRFQIFQRAQVFDDIAAGIIKEQFAVLGASDRDDPFELIAILEQIIDGLSDATARDDGNFWARRLFLFLLGHRFLLTLCWVEKCRVDDPD